MSITRTYNLGGINLFVNPLDQRETDLLRAVNVVSYPYGAKSRRPGLVTHLTTGDGSTVNSLFSWTKNDGTTLFLYRASGAGLYYSTQGTGAWTICGNGTITAGAHVSYAVLDNTLIVTDGAGSVRHSTNGTSFTNTTLAPVAVDLVEYQNRIYAAGTSSTLFYSTTGDATNWNTSGTSDSSSLTIPGAGKLLKLFKADDKLVVNKNSGVQKKWDGFNLLDMATNEGPSSPYSVASREGIPIFLNRDSINMHTGGRATPISNPIKPLIYNDSGSAPLGANFGTAFAEFYRYDYLLALGTATDDIRGETINDMVIKYNMLENEFLTWSFPFLPTAMHEYIDTSGSTRFLIGGPNGQCYHLSGTARTDNGTAIEIVLEFVTHLGAPDIEKRWFKHSSMFNPGCQAQIQIAATDTFTKDHLNWVDIGDARDGTVSYRFPTDSRSNLLFTKVIDRDKSSDFRMYGYAVDAIGVGEKPR